MEIEKSSSNQNEPETHFHCHLCSVSCASALNLQSHFLGIKHRKVEEALRNNKTDKEEPIEIKPNATLQEQIDACKNSEPALGLEYIYQYRKHGYNTYECKLCECRAGLTHMFMHIVGAKHRMNYLSKHHPSLGISGPYIIKGPKKLKKLRDICLTVEKEFGRQNINILEGVESPWSFSTDISGASSVYYTPDNEREQMDFTSDDFFDMSDSKPAASENIVTFLELKAAHEANQKDAVSSDSIAHNAEESEAVNKKNDTEMKVKDVDGESKNDTHEKAVHSKEPCESIQDFTNNKDLLDFLEHFRILEDGDAKFVATVVEMLSIALMRHKRLSKENEEKKLSVSKSDATNEQGKCKKQDPAPSVVPSYTNQDHKCHGKKESSSVSNLNKTGPLAEKNPLTCSESTSEPAETTAENQIYPITCLHDRKTVAESGLQVPLASNQSQGPVSEFNSTSPQFGTKPPVHSLSSNMPQESAIKRKDETPFTDPHLNHQVCIGQPGSLTTADQSPDPERKSKKQLVPIPQSNKIGPLGERKKLMFTLSSNKAQESAVKCNQWQESHGPTANYNAMTNEDKKEETSANYNQKQKITALQFGNRKPTSESHPSSLLTSALQNPVYPAPQVNRRAPFAQTRFVPPCAPFPPRAAPPLFPIAKDDIVNTFFESIKNMEVAEVISTLNKITTTNPAFKGIHVPSLVRYLTETGKLKSPQSMQQLNQ